VHDFVFESYAKYNTAYMYGSALIPNFYDSVFILNDSSIMQFIIVILLNMISNSFKKNNNN
jgi:hypothetical protein